jgi:hypothetical protein
MTQRFYGCALIAVLSECIQSVSAYATGLDVHILQIQTHCCKPKHFAYNTLKAKLPLCFKTSPSRRMGEWRYSSRTLNLGSRTR